MLGTKQMTGCNGIGPNEIARRKTACIARDNTDALTHTLERGNDNKACAVRNKRDDLAMVALECQSDTDYFNHLLEDGF
jgi:hypothetical protein